MDQLSHQVVQIRETDMRLPNLFIAGFWKCATTSLAKYLSDHPDVDTTRYKETYFFLDKDSPLEQEWGSASHLLDTTHEELFGTGGSAKYFLDATPCYYSQKAAFDHIQNNGGKTIFIVRDPSLRFCSSFEFFSHVYQEYPRTTLLNYTKQHLSSDLDGYLARMSSSFHSEILKQDLANGHYWNHIKDWKAAFGNDVIVISAEELQTNPSATLGRLCSFLEIEDIYGSYQFERFQKGYVVRSDAVHRALRRIFKFDPMEYGNFTNEHSHFHPLPKGILRNVLEQAYTYLQHRPVSYSEHAIELLKEYYEPYNRTLAQNTGINYSDDFALCSGNCSNCPK